MLFSDISIVQFVSTTPLIRSCPNPFHLNLTTEKSLLTHTLSAGTYNVFFNDAIGWIMFEKE